MTLPMDDLEFSWLDGPAEGAYGFAVGVSSVGSGPADSTISARMSREQLVAETHRILDSFNFARGIGEKDFRDPIPAQPWKKYPYRSGFPCVWQVPGTRRT